jgi:hypothetical protein
MSSAIAARSIKRAKWDGRTGRDIRDMRDMRDAGCASRA